MRNFVLMLIFCYLSTGIYLWDHYYVPNIDDFNIYVNDTSKNTSKNTHQEINYSYAINITVISNDCNNTYFHLIAENVVAMDYDSKLNFSNIFIKNGEKHIYFKFNSCPKHLIIITDKEKTKLTIQMYQDNIIFNEHLLLCSNDRFYRYSNDRFCSLDPEKYVGTLVLYKIYNYFN